MVSFRSKGKSKSRNKILLNIRKYGKIQNYVLYIQHQDFHSILSKNKGYHVKIGILLFLLLIAWIQYLNPTIQSCMEAIILINQ